jgi:predicted regulator of Ras-like GTPase activity (Roadblock/LC7/MglB family)
MGHLHQIVLHSGGNITVLTEVGEGVMGVFADTQEKGKLNSLIKSIKDAIEGESEDDAPDMVPETFDAEPAEEARAPIALATMPKPAKPVDEAKAKAAEEARLKAIEEAKAKAAEQARLAAEAQKKKEEKASVEGRSSFESVLAEGKIGDLSIDSIFGDLDDAQPVQNGSALEEPPVVALGPALDPDEITTMVISGKSALEKKSRELPKEEEDEVLSLGPAPIKDDDVVALGPVSAPEDDVVSLGSAPIPEPPAAKKKSVMDIVGVSERTTDEVLDKKAPEPEKAESTTKAVAADQIRDLLESLASSQSLPAVPVEEKVVAKDSKPVEKEVKPVEKEVKVAEKEVKAPEKKVEVDSDEETSEADDESRPEAKEVKEFGRLSAAASVSKETDTVGSMKTIGKMLIDAQAISNIIKAGENTTRGLTTARVISAARGEGIRSLLAQVDNYPGVVGSLIVGHDGLVIASTLPPSMDKDTLGALSIAMHSNANVATKKLELGTLQQLVCQCNDKATVLTEVDVGILCVFSDSWETTKLDGLIAAIDKTIKG